jgi:hypothetical protein
MKSTTLELSCALQANARTQHILSGRIRVEGIRLRFEAIETRTDICELPVLTLIVAAAENRSEWYGLPIFTERHFAKTTRYSIDRCVAVRREVVERAPWVVLNLFSAFQRAKAELVRELDWRLEPHFAVGVLDGRARAAIHTDAMPYGVSANLSQLEAIAQAALEDGLVSRHVSVDEIMAVQTLTL